MTGKKPRRLLVASVICIAIHGCQSSGVGTPLPNGGDTTFFLYAPPTLDFGDLALRIYGIDQYKVFDRNPNYSNHPSRPSGTPADWVAYTAVAHDLDGGVIYDADLMRWNGVLDRYEFEDTVEPFTANSEILISPDN